MSSFLSVLSTLSRRLSPEFGNSVYSILAILLVTFTNKDIVTVKRASISELNAMTVSMLTDPNTIQDCSQNLHRLDHLHKFPELWPTFHLLTNLANRVIS